MEQNPITITIVVGEDLCCSHVATLFDDKASADLTITGGSESTKKLRAHSHLLSSASPVFKKMLEGDWKESGGVVELKEIDWDVVIALISLIYMRPVDLREDLLVDLYRAAHMYDVPVALKAVVGCVPRMESKECIVNLAITASSLGGECEDDMASVCGLYLFKCLDDVADIGRMPYKAMLAVAKAEGTDLEELTILRNLLKWSREHKEEVTLEERRELFSYIRYGQVPLEDMLEAISAGGFPCGEEFTKIMLLHRSGNSADIAANLPLFTPRSRHLESPSFKEFFPVAMHKRSSNLICRYTKKIGWTFVVKDDFCVFCKDQCSFSISVDQGLWSYSHDPFKYLNMKICTPGKAKSSKMCLSFEKRYVQRIHIHVMPGQFTLYLYKDSGPRRGESFVRCGDPFFQDLEEDTFPLVFKFFYSASLLSGEIDRSGSTTKYITKYHHIYDCVW
jgi:hypothetical protein